MFQFVSIISVQEHGDNIETHLPGVVGLAHVSTGCFCDITFFSPRNGCRRMAKAKAPAGLHLDKNQTVFLRFSDQVNFQAAVSVATSHDGVAIGFQVFSGEGFTDQTSPLLVRHVSKIGYSSRQWNVSKALRKGTWSHVARYLYNKNIQQHAKTTLSRPTTLYGILLP